MINYNENLADNVRRKLIQFSDLEEKLMFNGLVFMLNGKMLVGVTANELMVRINPEEVENVIERIGCRQMIHGNRPMKGYLFIEEEILRKPSEFNFWLDLALAYNPFAKSSKTKRK